MLIVKRRNDEGARAHMLELGEWLEQQYGAHVLLEPAVHAEEKVSRVLRANLTSLVFF